MKKNDKLSNEQLPEEELQIEDLDAEGDELSEKSPKKQFTNPLKNLTKDQFRLILKVLMAVLIVMVFVSAYMVFNVWSQYQKSINKYNELENYVNVAETERVESTRTLVADEPAEEEAAAEEPSRIQIDFDMDFEALSKINPDVMGWIYYEPLEISYPVVVDRGDDYYEHYAFDLEKNVAGAIFIDYACRPDMKSFNTVIYGHNMRNGTMFGSLKKLLSDPAIIEEDPYFYVITKDKIFMYEIFADYTCKANAPTYDLKMEYTKEDMQGYLDYIRDTAEYKRDAFFEKPLDEELKIVTLSTCHGLHSTTRTVVHGELIEVADR